MRRSAAHTVLVLVLCSAAWGAEGPVAVSPGNTSKLALIGDTCPTFSWGEVEGAKSYELVVYRVSEQTDEAQPVLRETFAGSASSWTPSLDLCLERGGQYAWSVRAMGRKEASEWSTPSLFEVSAAPSVVEVEEAMAVLRRFLGDEGTGIALESDAGLSGAAAPTVVGPSAGRSTADPAPLSAVAGDSALQVNGSAVVTVATLAGALCSATEVRYLDQGDGTVLDCNTGKMWLKDASCLGKWPYEDGANPNIFDKVTDLNNGTDFGCADYTAGTYTDWEVPTISDWCSAGAINQTCPLANASDSLIDSSLSVPSVVNASGDGQWMADDAFILSMEFLFWSATVLDADKAWLAFLTNGLVATTAKSFPADVLPVRAVP